MFIKSILYFIWDVVKIAIIALLIVIPIRVFIFQPFFVRGASMEPNFHNYDYLIVDQISYRFSEPERGDIVVFYNPNNPSERFIKRVIGLPGESLKITEGDIYVESQGKGFHLEESVYLPAETFTSGTVKVTMGGDEYFVLGDNRSASYDSRIFGTIKKESIIGKVGFRLWPFRVFAQN
jgi:signal peptidase I